jgi:hypothetical protein
MSNSSDNKSRRLFLTKAAKAALGASLLPNIITAADRKRNLESLSRRHEKFAANDQINFAVIGAGGMGNC